MPTSVKGTALNFWHRWQTPIYHRFQSFTSSAPATQSPGPPQPCGSPSLPRPYMTSSPPRSASSQRFELGTSRLRFWPPCISVNPTSAAVAISSSSAITSSTRHRTPNSSSVLPVPYRQCTASQPRLSRSFLSSSPCCRNQSSNSTSPD